MNYQRIYNNLISYRQNNPATGYTEKHHIVMKSMGGSNDPSNLVVLTGREHWIAHLLLYKIHKNNKTVHACRMMGFKSKTNFERTSVKNSRMYAHVREYCYAALSLSQRGKNNSQYGKIWIYNIDLKKSKRIKNGDVIPNGWRVGYKLFDRKIHYQKCHRCESTYESENLRRKYCQTCLESKSRTTIKIKPKFIWMTNGFLNLRIREDKKNENSNLRLGKSTDEEIASLYISLYKEFKTSNCSLRAFVKDKKLPISFMTLKNNFIKYTEYFANKTKHSKYKST